MTTSQKQFIINAAAQGTGNLARLINYPDSHFSSELDKLIHTLTLQRTQMDHPVYLDDCVDEDL
jgi:hypothetical protein